MNESSFISRSERQKGGDSIKAQVKADKYHLILEAAIRVFAENGFYQSTISQIAREAGVADGTIYLYFKNKDDILLQFFTYRTKVIFDQFWKEVEKGETAIEKLTNLIRCHLEAFQQDMNMAVVFQAETRTNHHMRDKFNEMSRKYLGVVGEIIEQGQYEGSLRQELYLGLVKRFILGSVNEVINTWVLAGGKYSLVSMAEPLVNLIIHGIGFHEAKSV